MNFSWTMSSQISAVFVRCDETNERSQRHGLAGFRAVFQATQSRLPQWWSARRMAASDLPLACIGDATYSLRRVDTERHSSFGNEDDTMRAIG